MRAEDELAAALVELNRERRALYDSERADMDGRVTNRGIWRAALRRRRQRVAELEQTVRNLTRADLDGAA